MLKRILVVLDGSKAAAAAKLYAVELAQATDSALTGVGVIDTPWITAAQPEPLGGAAFKIHRDKVVIRQTHERIQKMLDGFMGICKENDVACQVSELEGFPATEIENMSEENDMIVIGKTTDFHFDLDDDSDLTVKHIIRDNPRPIIVVTGPSKAEGDVLIAYDGSLQAARALHMFLLLGLAKGRKVHAISIAPRQKEANLIVMRARNMCELHGVEVVAEGIVSSRAPENTIQKKAKEIGASVIIMGAFGHHGLRELFFGSTTEHMMKHSEVPLFIHH
ncbi:MAG: universal stress protein [Alphaproteobacteria bacterium]